MNLPTRWRYGFSATLKGIYLIRYLLFSGGAAIAAAMVERLLFPGHAPVAGWVLGLGVGLFVFRGQLFPLSWPTLLLSRDHLYLVRKRQAMALPWKSVRAVRHDDARVTLELGEPMRAPDGQLADQISLEAKKLGTPAGDLVLELERLLTDPKALATLPEDVRVRRDLGLL
ncbi:MAG: hypothetical protein ACOZIN_03150 [Myxococcota bacterium]